MICAKCNTQMHKGYIPAKQAIVWKPEGASLVFSLNYIQLGKTPFLKVEKVEAYYCSCCNHVIVPLNQE